MRPHFLYLLVFATLLPVAASAEPAQIMDSRVARARGLVAVELTVPVHRRWSGEQAVLEVLRTVGRRGARYVGGLHWVWTQRSRDGRLDMECSAPLTVMGRRGRLHIATGPSHCLPTSRTGAADEIRGEMYLRPWQRGLERGEMELLYGQLEPQERVRGVRRRARRRARPRSLSRRELRGLIDQLE